MQLAFLDWAIIVAFFAFSLGVGLLYTKKAGENMSEFFLGGRNLPWWIAGTSMVATTFAADTPLAVNELVAQSGISGNWLWWNALAGGMLTTLFFARYWRRAGILTDVELVELRYSGREAAFLRGFKAVYLGVFMNALIIGWVNKAMMTILQVFFDIPESELLWYIAACMLLVVIYSSLSGLWGVAITDVVQFIIAMFGCIVLAVLVVNSEKVGGISGLKAQLPEGALNIFPSVGGHNVGTTLALSVGTFLAFVTVQWWASWYPGAEPGGGGYVAQRMMSAKNERHAVLATLFFQIMHYCIRPWPWILVGLSALILYPDLADKKMGYVMAMKDFLPPGLRGLLLVAFFAAYMSTISTQLNWGASYIINDFFLRFVKPKATDKQLVSASRIATVTMMAVALYATSLIGSISAVWQFIMECGAGLGLVLILRWYWWRVNAWSEITATIAPFLAYSFVKFSGVLPEEWSVYPNSFFLTVGFTTIAWIAVTYLTPNTSDEVLTKFYERVRPAGSWKPVYTRMGIAPEKSTLGLLGIAWVLAIAMGYSILFFIGNIILAEWTLAGVSGTIALVSGFLFNYITAKAQLFDE